MGSRVKITLKITYIAKILWIGTRGSIGVCNKAVAKDDLLSLFTTSRNIVNSSQYTFGVFRLPMVPMATNGTNGKITIGKTPNVPIIMVVFRYCSDIVILLLQI